MTVDEAIAKIESRRNLDFKPITSDAPAVVVAEVRLLREYIAGAETRVQQQRSLKEMAMADLEQVDALRTTLVACNTVAAAAFGPNAVGTSREVSLYEMNPGMSTEVDLPEANRMLTAEVLRLQEATADVMRRLELAHDDADKYQLRALGAESEVKRLRASEVENMLVADLGEVVVKDLQAKLARITEKAGYLCRAISNRGNYYWLRDIERHQADLEAELRGDP